MAVWPDTGPFIRCRAKWQGAGTNASPHGLDRAAARHAEALGSLRAAVDPLSADIPGVKPVGIRAFGEGNQQLCAEGDVYGFADRHRHVFSPRRIEDADLDR